MTIATSGVAELVSQLSGDNSKAFHARQKLREEIARLSTPDSASESSQLADALVVELIAMVEPTGPRPRMTNVPDDITSTAVPKHPPQIRRLLCQLLNPIATDAQVPALAAALADLEMREPVRAVLSQIPTLVSTSELVKAMKLIGPEFRVGVLNALGQERWREAAVTLIRSAQDADPEIRLAALEGLANFPEADNDKWFVAAAQLGTPRQRARAIKARVRLAETLRISGEMDSARVIYASIASDTPEGPWKKAARIGLAQIER